MCSSKLTKEQIIYNILYIVRSTQAENLEESLETFLENSLINSLQEYNNLI